MSKTFKVRYKQRGQWFWRNIKNVHGELLIPFGSWIYHTEKDANIYVPVTAEIYSEAELLPAGEKDVRNTYTIKYRLTGQWFWRRVRRVVEEGLLKEGCWFFRNKKGGFLYIPKDAEVKLGPARQKALAKNIKKETGVEVLRADYEDREPDFRNLTPNYGIQNDYCTGASQDTPVTD